MELLTYQVVVPFLCTEEEDLQLFCWCSDTIRGVRISVLTS